ncbi:hypothetical protein [Asaia astilbis]|uniref:hypothetical protein n=1 Tax=Asaia astilbis TaxID=610244 RepID=UPI00046F9D76|nr:hypothetical protein [Asaia astilbis]
MSDFLNAAAWFVVTVWFIAAVLIVSGGIGALVVWIGLSFPYGFLAVCIATLFLAVAYLVIDHAG